MDGVNDGVDALNFFVDPIVSCPIDSYAEALPSDPFIPLDGTNAGISLSLGEALLNLPVAPCILDGLKDGVLRLNFFRLSELPMLLLLIVLLLLGLLVVVLLPCDVGTLVDGLL